MCPVETDSGDSADRERQGYQEDARQLVDVLTEIKIAIDGERMEYPEKTLSERVLALLSDSRSLARGISQGHIKVSQPRIATNLVSVVAELEETGHHDLAIRCQCILDALSDRGLAAENCMLGRERGSPGRH